MESTTLAFALLITLLLSGCSGNPVIPVSDLTPQRSKYVTRIVLEGDTLYNIAWEFGLDYREVAFFNGLRTPYRVIPGQKIRIGSAKESVQSNGLETPTVVKALTKNIVRAQKLTDTDPNDPNSRIKEKSVNVGTAQGLVWSWPSGGRVIGDFSEANGNNGIDIVDKEGSPVLAAASGTIVYAGSGLRGYGHLLILKHNEQFLSAYAHNSLLLVDEGDSVQAGQVIAHMGSTGAETVKLHFEIRVNGKPVDPLMHLPAKQ